MCSAIIVAADAFGQGKGPPLQRRPHPQTHPHRHSLSFFSLASFCFISSSCTALSSSACFRAIKEAAARLRTNFIRFSSNAATRTNAAFLVSICSSRCCFFRGRKRVVVGRDLRTASAAILACSPGPVVLLTGELLGRWGRWGRCVGFC